ncbi:MAG: hypothetical protein AB7U82_29815 [Blastocatellales bacterium]
MRITALVSRRISKTSVLRSVIILSSLLALGGLALAQTISPMDGHTPPGMAPGAPAGSYALSGFESVNPYNGGLNFHMPLLQVGGRGKAGYMMTLPIEQRWSVQRSIIDYSSYTPQWASYNWWTDLKPGYSPGVMSHRGVAKFKVDCESQGAGQMDWYRESLTRLTFTAADGTEYEFRDVHTGGSILSDDRCGIINNRRGRVWVTGDGSAATFIADHEIYDNQSTPADGGLVNPNQVISLSGHLILRDGTRYRIDNGRVTWIRDPNGNKVSYTYSNNGYGPLIEVKDSLNRVVTITYGNPDVVTFKGFGGATRQVKVWYKNLSYSQSNLSDPDRMLRSDFTGTVKTFLELFPSLDASPTTPFDPLLVSAVELPDGRKYRFKYNYYGELARVDLPTGGAYEYDWAPGPGADAYGVVYVNIPNIYNAAEIYRRVSERRVMKEAAVLEGRTIFTASHPNGFDPTPWVTTAKVEQKDASGNLLSGAKHYYYGSPTGSMGRDPFEYAQWDDGKEYQSESLAADGLTVLGRINQTWQNPSGGPPSAANNPRVTETVNTLLDVSPNLVSKQTHINPSNGSVAYDQYNNPTESWEYDFGQGSPGALLRHTRAQYLTSGYDTVAGTALNPNPGATIHIRSLL